MTVPFVQKLTMDITSMGATVDFSAPFQPAPFACQVTLVQYVPAQTQTADTAVASTFRTYTLYNRGQGAATGTTALARGALTSLSASITAFGTSTAAGLTDNIASTLPLTTTALLTLAANDVLEWESSHSSVGLRDVGGRVIVTLARI